MNTDIKLVALDLDRTTLNSESHLSEVNRQALIDAISNGVHVCIASGRAFDTLPEDVISVPGIEYAQQAMVLPYTVLQAKSALNPMFLHRNQ